MYKKSTGWVPDYPDFRDYRMNEINQKLIIAVQDTQINNDNDSQSSIEELFELLNSIKDTLNFTLKDTLNSTLKDTLDSKFDKFDQKISKGFKLVNAQVPKEQIFLAHGCAGQEVYNLQNKLLHFTKHKKKFGSWKHKIIDFLKTLKESDYIEYGYFGKNTQEGVKLFKSIFGLSTGSDDSVDSVVNQVTLDSVDSVVDQVTLYTLNKVLEILERETTSEDEDTEKTVKRLGMFDPKEIKDIQRKLNKLGYLKNLGENNGAIKGFFDDLTQDAVQEFQRQYCSYTSNVNDVGQVVYEHPNASKISRVDGIVDKNTKTTLDNLFISYDAQPKQSYGNREVKELQKLLRELGEFDGQVTGYPNPQTRASVKSFHARYCVDSPETLPKTLSEILPKTLEVLRELVKLKRQQWREVVPASPTIPISLYEIILRVFEISEFKVESFVNEKGFQEYIDDGINEHQNTLKRAIDMIVKLVAQLISPLAQHRNLEKAVRDVLEKLDQWFDKSEYVNCIRQQNSPKVNKELSESPQPRFWEQSSNFPQAKQETNLFENWDLNPLSLYIALSAILNFKLSLKKAISDQDRRASSLKKIDDIFKSIKDLKISRENYNPQLQEENNSKNQLKNLRTVIKILPDIPEKLKEFEKHPEFQSDLQLPIEGNLQKDIRSKQEDSEKATTVYLLMPEFVDLSFWCSPIEDQGSLDSCTAHVGVALMEYFEKKSFDRYVDASRLFLYKATRNLMHRQGDAGASLRETMRAMALFGVPPEEYWPYREDKFDEEPTPFCYSFGQSYQALKYFRLNPLGTTEDILLFRIKTALAAGFPCAFGFTMYYSIEDLNPSGYIPYPVKNDKVKGGHAVVAVGYDDYKVIENVDSSRRSQGALLIRNSWGTDWGEGGYGWLPYDYVLEGLTNDWWSLLKSKWFETGHFGLGANLGGASRDGTPQENHRPSGN